MAPAMSPTQRRQAAAGHGLLPSHHLVQDAAQGVHIGGHRHLFPVPLLGCHVQRRAYDTARQLRPPKVTALIGQLICDL